MRDSPGCVRPCAARHEHSHLADLIPISVEAQPPPMACAHDTVQRALCPAERSSWPGRGRQLRPSPVRQAASRCARRRHGELSTDRCPRRRRYFPQGDGRRHWLQAGRGFVQPWNVKNRGGGLTPETTRPSSPPPRFSTFLWSVRPFAGHVSSIHNSVSTSSPVRDANHPRSAQPACRCPRHRESEVCVAPAKGPRPSTRARRPKATILRLYE